LKNLFGYFFYGNIYIGLLAAGLVWSNSILFNSVNYHLIFLTFFSSIVVYNLDRLFALSADYENSPDRSRFISQHKDFFVAIILFCGLGAACLIPYFTALLLRVVLFSAFLTIFYLYLYNFKSNNSINNISCLKPALLGFVWAFVTLYLPLMQANIAFDFSMTPYLFGARFSEYYINGILFDFRDIGGDRSIGKGNIFIFWNQRMVFLFISLIFLLNFVVIIFGLITGFFHLFIMGDFIVIIFYFFIAFISLSGSRKKNKILSSPWFYPAAMDGILFLPVIFSGVAVIFRH